MTRLGATRSGTVVAFDEDRGLGDVVADDGTQLPFHCSAVADGTRTVAVGAKVEFVVVPGPLGYEAGAIRVRATPVSAG
jgi:cold shock CspA family protein